MTDTYSGFMKEDYLISRQKYLNDSKYAAIIAL